MAHDPSHEHHANVDHTAMGIEKEHPTWSTYWKVATILTLITAVEVWIYYIPSFVASRAFVPTLLILSAVKFATVVLFYMHSSGVHTPGGWTSPRACIWPVIESE